MLGKGASIHDISISLNDGLVAYPGDPGFQRQILHSPQQGDAYESSSLAVSCHAGTHIDLPAHFIPGGQRMEDHGPERFILPARVVEVSDPVSIQPESFRDCGIRAGEAILFKTANSQNRLLEAPVFQPDYVYLSEAGARLCAEIGLKLAGIDYLSIDRYGSETYGAHHQLLSRDILILEGIDLSRVTVGVYTLICLPLKIASGEASPVRAVLVA